VTVDLKWPLPDGLPTDNDCRFVASKGIAAMESGGPDDPYERTWLWRARWTAMESGRSGRSHEM
jgi:hypothetical protein